MIRRPPRSTPLYSSAASDVYKRQLDAASGDIVWKNEGTGSNYILQPHRSPAFADVAPQGAFTISRDKLLVAGGRSVPAVFDLKTGEEIYYPVSYTHLRAH